MAAFALKSELADDRTDRVLSFLTFLVTVACEPHLGKFLIPRLAFEMLG
jgi:hypothetical protein